MTPTTLPGSVLTAFTALAVFAASSLGCDTPAAPSDAGPSDAARADGAIATPDARIVGDAGPPVDAPIADTGAAAPSLGAPDATLVADALAAPLGWFGQNDRGERFCSGCDGASIVLAVASFLGDSSTDARLLEQMRYVLGDGRDPFGNGGYLAQWERMMTGMFALARLTPRVWSALTPEEVARVDLVMQATLVGSAYTTADRTNASGVPTGIDGDTNLNRGWNPNYREGMVGAVLVSTAYLGGRASAEAFLDAYDHTAFVAALEAAGLTHLRATFDTARSNPAAGAPSGAQIADGVRGYRYYDHDLDHLGDIFIELTQNTFSGTVACGLNDGAGVDAAGTRSGLLVEGCAGLPNLGALGMLKEFDSSDAVGPRSSIDYAYDGFKPNLINHLVLLAYGAMPRTAALDAAIGRARIGATDLFYKATHGYRSYARGSDRGLYQLPPDGHDRGFEFFRPLWEEVVLPAYE